MRNAESIKCDGRKCRKRIWGTTLPKLDRVERNSLVVDGWNFIQLNGRVLVFCPRHLVSVEVEPRKLKESIKWK